VGRGDEQSVVDALPNSVVKGGGLLLNADMVTLPPIRAEVRIVRAPVVTMAAELDIRRA